MARTDNCLARVGAGVAIGGAVGGAVGKLPLPPTKTLSPSSVVPIHAGWSGSRPRVQLVEVD